MSPFIRTGRPDPTPDVTRRKVIQVLAAAGRSMRRREIQIQVFGGDVFGDASKTVAALNWLRDHQMVARSAHDTRGFVVTQLGRNSLELADMVNPSEAS